MSDTSQVLVLQFCLRTILVAQLNRLKTPRKSLDDRCVYTNVASIELLKALKVVKFRCFDETVARFLYKLQANGNQANIIVHEKSRFEGSSGHHSLLDNLDHLAKAIKVIPHNNIEIVMKKDDEKNMKKIKAKLSHYIPDSVKISFSK